MLETLLNKLESLFSKSFLIGSIPLLAFLFLHGLMVYHVNDPLRQWLRAYPLDAVHLTVPSFAILLVVVILSYVLSTLNEFLRELLEGKYFKFEWLANLFGQRYRNRLAVVESKFQTARRWRRHIRENEAPWRSQMKVAYNIGKNLHTCTYQRPSELAALFNLRQGNKKIPFDKLEAEIAAMTAILNANSPVLDTPNSSDLDQDYVGLFKLIDYAIDKWESDVVKYFNEIEFDFAGKDVAPTAMGNIANIAPYYAASRYSMNLQIFWTRLQKLVRADPNFFPLLQQAKMQLDFMVALIWQTIAFTVVWVILLPLMTDAKILFTVIAIGGPILIWGWYQVALQNYRILSDLLRAVIDLYRLDLLKALHLPLPVSAEQERESWQILEQRLGYADRQNVSLQSF